MLRQTPEQTSDCGSPSRNIQALPQQKTIQRPIEGSCYEVCEKQLSLMTPKNGIKMRAHRGIRNSGWSEILFESTLKFSLMVLPDSMYAISVPDKKVCLRAVMTNRGGKRVWTGDYACSVCGLLFPDPTHPAKLSVDFSKHKDQHPPATGK